MYKSMTWVIVLNSKEYSGTLSPFSQDRPIAPQNASRDNYTDYLKC